MNRYCEPMLQQRRRGNLNSGAILPRTVCVWLIGEDKSGCAPAWSCPGPAVCVCVSPSLNQPEPHGVPLSGGKTNKFKKSKNFLRLWSQVSKPEGIRLTCSRSWAERGHSRASGGPGVAKNGISAKSHRRCRGRDSHPRPGGAFRNDFSASEFTKA